jgi:hypothetical protein
MRSSRGWILVLGFGIALGCAPSLPKPEPPRGKGWFTYNQGYHQFTQTSSSSSSGGRTTTTTSATSELANIELHEKLTPDRVDRKLQVGRNVADYAFNAELEKE